MKSAAAANKHAFYPAAACQQGNYITPQGAATEQYRAGAEFTFTHGGGGHLLTAQQRHQVVELCLGEMKATEVAPQISMNIKEHEEGAPCHC